jgi:two-component system copper resistance phosphate regulon response regulator CusR
VGAFDLILLDVMMPGRSGWDLLEELRGCGDATPVIFVTARHEVDERVRGLRLGADDYVIKPFDLAELLARIHAVLRRRGAPTLVQVGDLRIDLVRRNVEDAGRRIELSALEFSLLRALAEAKGRVLSRRELLRQVWDIDFETGTNAVDVQVARLRRKIGKSGPLLVQTVVGQGYRLAEPQAPSA